MPVRVKQRGVDAERGIHSKHWESLKRDIIALLLSWHSCVSVSARELANRWTLSIHNSHTRDREHGLDLITRVSKILYQAQLSDEIRPETWVPLKASAGSFSIAGAVSLCPIATKRIQFLSIGIQPVSNEHGSNVLYEEINRVFSNSSYGVEEAMENVTRDNDKEGPQKGVKTEDNFKGQDLKGRKGVDRWPMFYMKIDIDEYRKSTALEEVDELLDERRGNLAAIVDVLRAVAYEFLRKHQFRPKRIRYTKRDISRKSSKLNSPVGSPSRKTMSRSSSAAGTRKNELVGDLATTQLNVHRDKSSCSRPESPFDFWSRIKSGSSQQTPSVMKPHGQLIDHEKPAPSSSEIKAPILSACNSDIVAPLFGPDGSLLRAPFATTEPVPLHMHRERQSSEMVNESTGIKWTNPVTKETSLIDPTTGFIIQPPTKRFQEHGDQAALVCRKRPSSHGTPVSDEGRSVWLRELLSSWENPIFKTTEPHIPSAIGDPNNLRQSLESFGCCTWTQGSTGVGPPVQSRVTKAALRDAEIIAQIDRKFIFAKVPVLSNVPEHEPTILHSTASLLVIIDQHAADERCRVESLMKDYFMPIDKTNMSNSKGASSTALMPGTSIACTEMLERPLKFDISVRDATQFANTASHFNHWGIYYHIVQVPSTGNTNQRYLEVTRLPSSIAERCRVELRLLIELLRKEAWKLDHSDHHSTAPRYSNTQDGESAASHWITQFHGCPEGILDMINSRACRSSIMFNDALTLEECRDLVQRLADCAFPFQCAHGRPSMVPLVDIGNDMTCPSNEREEPSDSFEKAFKAWNARG